VADWDDMSVDDKLEALRSAVETLGRRLDELLQHLNAVADAVDALELKLRQ
jgi:ABC-type transporter Mla subunit MlaD